jgi:hypothetical protein
MNKENSENKDPQSKKPSVEKEIIREAHQEIDEFNEARKTIADLVTYRRNLQDPEQGDLNRFNEMKDKAIDAINHLFNEESAPEPK